VDVHFASQIDDVLAIALPLLKPHPQSATIAGTGPSVVAA
jgi:hypothetical protein